MLLVVQNIVVIRATESELEWVSLLSKVLEVTKNYINSKSDSIIDFLDDLKKDLIGDTHIFKYMK